MNLELVAKGMLSLAVLGLGAMLLVACGTPVVPAATPSPSPVPSATSTATATATPMATATPEEVAARWERLVRYVGSFDSYTWRTDYSRSLVSPMEIASILARDAIAPIDSPQLVSVQEADQRLGEYEPVAVAELNGEARAYPLRVLIAHEVVNDELGGVPIGVTY